MPLGSWYSQLPAFGWFDPEDRPGSAALGVPDSQQGIALPSRATLGKWFNVTPPGGGLPFPMQQTDIGPAKWTGRGVDISAAAAHQMGYTPQNFPTNADFKIEPRDEPRGLGSPAGLPVQAGDLPDNAVPDAYASASAPSARKPMPGLMDLISGNASPSDVFQPVDASGQPTNFAGALAGQRNSLIGLGMGLLQPRSLAQGAPVSSAWSNALGGYMQGAQADATNAYKQAVLAHQKTQDARQAIMDKFNREMAEKQFAQSTMTPYQKMQTDIAKGGTAAEQFYAQQLGNVPQIASIDDPDNPGDKISVLFNPRAPAGQQITRINGPGRTAGADPFAGVTNPLAPGGSTAQAPAPGGAGAVGYGTAGMGPGGFGGSGGGGASTQPSIPFASAGPTQSGQGPVEAKTMREARAKAVISNEEEAVKSAKAAAEFKPALDEMTAAYEALAKAGGVGPIQGSTVGRAVQSITPYGNANESLRQRYDTAKGKVQALITAAQNKGEGSVSNYERQMFGAQFPQLNALDAKTQLPFLRQLQSATEQSITAGRGTSLGPSPGTFMRPPIEQSQPSASGQTSRQAAPRPGFVKGGYVFKGGDPSDQNNWAPVK